MPKKIYENIIDNIVSMIKSGALNEGDRLPPERKLATTFQVSRNTVREAIKTLAEKKVLESRTGSGTYVAESGRGIIEETVQKIFEEKKHRLKDIFELRKILEPQIAYLAAERIQASELSSLKNILIKQNEAFVAYGDPRPWDELFHQTLAKAADNTVLYHVYEKLTDIFSESREQGLQSAERNKKSIEIHKKILDALENKDAHSASKHMKRHMLQIQKSMKQIDKLRLNAGGSLIKDKN